MNLDNEPTATVEREADGARLEFERLLEATPERVWAALTEPAELARWMYAREVEVDPPRRLTIRFADGFENGGAILAWEPARRLEFEWSAGDAPSVVSFTLEAEGAGTRLRLTHARLPEAETPGTLTGWHAHLIALEEWLHGREMAYDAVFNELAPRYGAKPHHEYAGGD